MFSKQWEKKTIEENRITKPKYIIRGEWDNEPDYLRFKAHGLDCCLSRTSFTGSWCGYVRLPPNHHGIKKFHDGDHSVHGGITYSHLEQDGSFIIGFDCGHHGDLSPGMELKNFPSTHQSYGTYRNLEYAKKETEDLAEQFRQPNSVEYIKGSEDEVY